jgi:DNA-binding GntR family transcriptional regulator
MDAPTSDRPGAARRKAKDDAAGPEAKDAGPEPNGLIADRAYRDLRDRIVTLRLPPGSVLREDELMPELGIGRTPLREAIKRLALENLVAVEPRRGTSVTDVETADIVHITEVRAELEGQAAELAAKRMDEEHRAIFQQLRADLDAFDEADQEALMRFDERIHEAIWEASRNPYLMETLERYFALSLRIWYLVLTRVPGLGGAVHDQVRLLDALLARDAGKARELMREHVLDFQREILAAFSRS